MSKPRPTRPNAKNAQPKVATAEIVVAMETKPAEAAVVAEVVEAVAVEPSAEVASKAKAAPKKAVIITISVARTRRHLDKLNLNMVLESKIAEHKKELSLLESAETLLSSKKVSVVTIVEATDANGKVTKTKAEQTRDATEQELADAATTVAVITPQKGSHKMHITALTRERTRFSFNAPVMLSIVCDEMIESLLDHTIDRALAGGKKIIQISHLHEAGVESLPLYSLFSKLPSFKANAEKLAAELSKSKSAEHDAALLSQAEKDFKKKYAACLPKVQKGPKVAADASKEEKPAEAKVADAVKEAKDAADDSEDSKAAFKQYVTGICKLLKSSEKYAEKSIKFSNEIRSYLSDLVAEFIHRISSLVALTASSMKNKTINDVAVMRTIESIMIDGHSPVETIEFQDEQVRDPDFMKAEAARKKTEGAAYKAPAEIPKVAGKVAIRSVSYPTSGYAALASKVTDKFSKYKPSEEELKQAKDAEAEVL